MSSIRLIPVHEANARDPATFLWQLLGERRAEDSISHRNMPSLREHLDFIDSKPYRAWYIVEALDATWVGQVSLTRRNEIGIQIAREHQRRGFAREAVRLVMAAHNPLPAERSERQGDYIANINPKNAASIALFESLGATLLQVTYQLPGD